MITNSFVPHNLYTRQMELQQVIQILTADGDIMVTGVPGSGRRSLLRFAAAQIGARVLEIDCLRATTSSRFLELLAEGLLEVFSNPSELKLIEKWASEQPLKTLKLEQVSTYRSRLTWQVLTKEEWAMLETLLSLPQAIAEQLNCRVIFVFQNFPHIRSWDRSGQWEAYLRQELKQHSHVSYAIVATVPESWAYDSNFQVIALAPLKSEELQSWIVDVMSAKGLRFEMDAMDLFLDYVRGHLGDAIALARRIWQEYFLEGIGDETPKNLYSKPLKKLIQLHNVNRSTLTLVEDLSTTFESLLLLLPPIQARVLESLAIDPTDSPHGRNYIRKHQLSKGGGLQGALAGLEQKGLIYGAKYGYNVAMPLLAFWLKQRLL